MDCLVTPVKVVYNLDAVSFSVRQLYRGTSPLVEFLFVLVSRPQSVDIQSCLLATEMFHPAGKYTKTVQAVEWAL